MARWMFLIGLLVSLGMGSWWIADAVQAGDSMGVVLRFTVTTIAGAYYIVLYQAFAPQRPRSAQPSVAQHN